MNPKVLFVAYQFPPIGGPGVQRSTMFVKYLREFGIEPLVLTIDYKGIEQAKYQTDTSLLNSLPPDIEIVRTSSAQYNRFKNLLHTFRVYRLFWFLFYPFFWEKQALWPFTVYRQAASLIKAGNIETVYTSSGPFSSLLLGYLLKKRLKVNWVADMRDPFTDAYAWSFPSKLHWYFARFIEKKILSAADRLIVNTPEVAKLYAKRGISTPARIRVITNGF